ncbi:hypothetical protein J2X31_000863 [Flavobacterium arsenatis]|uniref:RagB/SusD family nutrient uptake outer membrane protein n=1 Tax=Flavobacterium arsenatis TaxID=1484332 RepID=A0ABU1TN66_9FLAO|nr:RagB/SusD family nutrient uptake outer membrane protein [Flavobacterium arsenatis]MDR6966863.1 hypothetical protein [Flavobacterium arsenatis]
MKNLNKYILLLICTSLFISCDEEFLNPDKNALILEDNFYANEEDAYGALVATYDIFRKQSGGFENLIAMMNAGSDDHFAGGGGATDGAGIQSFSNFTITGGTMPRSFWSDYFKGVFRANKLLEKLPGIPMNENVKTRFTAEAKALRAYYNFELVRMFGNIPLLTRTLNTTEVFDVPQASKEEVYAQIELDLVEAITDLPMMLPDPGTEAGRFSRGSAQALLGKVYLYQGKNALAAEQLAQVNGTPGETSQYGYKLLDNFADLWIVDNKFHSEAILSASHTNLSNSDWGSYASDRDEGNTLNVMVGPRGYIKIADDAPDFASGWSFNVVTQDLFDAMSGDPRFNATIANLKLLKQEGKIDYATDATYMDTGYYLRKFMPLKSDVTTGGGVAETNYRQNTYVIRLADTYLMEAEALGATGARAQALLDAVRARVGLGSIPVSMDAIINERRLELAGEGHRFYDLVRTGRAATVLGPKGFISGKNEILPIPMQELNNTLIQQNLNYPN